jgi:hypothetical protein
VLRKENVSASPCMIYAAAGKQTRKAPRSLLSSHISRYVAISNVVVLQLAGFIWASSALAADIAVRQIQPDKYEFLLTNPTSLSEREAMAHIAQVAATVCKDKTPMPGRYRYDSKEKISGGDGSNKDTEGFRFVQEVSCVSAAPTQAVERKPILKDDNELQRVRNEVQRKSESYFQLIAAERIDEVVAQVSVTGLGVSEAEWKSDKLSFKKMAGEPVEISIKKITVYDNPKESPEPGVYVAADYSNVYRNLPIHCGYLMWFRPIGGEFRVTREESGHVTAEQLKTIPSERLPALKRQLRCPP